MSENSTISRVENPRRKLLPLFGLIIVLGLGILIYSVMSSKPALVAEGGTIKIGCPIRQDLAGEVEMTGVLDSNGTSNISSQISGVVSQVMVKVGDKVKKGDVLLSLDQRDLQIQLSQAQINVQKAQNAADQAKIAYEQAETDYERSQQLYQSEVLSNSDLEQITQKRDLCKFQYEAALNIGIPAAGESLKLAQLAMNKTDLVSPVDASVATCSINPGDFINANTSGAVITLVMDDIVTLAGNVNEKFINILQVGQKVDVQIDNLVGVNVSGEISYISPVSIPTGQFFPVKITLQNPDSLLKPGMTASAVIHVMQTGSVTVPKTAIIRRDGQTCVFVVKDKKAVQTWVIVGLQGDKFVAIDQGLTTEEEIVTDGTDAVLDGMTLPLES